MLDIGGLELLVIVAVALIAIGPKELPGAIRSVMRWIQKTRSLAQEFQSGLAELSREAGVAEIRREIEQAASREQFDKAARGLGNEIMDEDTRKLLEDPDTKKLLAEIESDNYFAGSPAEEPPSAEPEQPKKLVEAPPGATGS